MRTTRILSLFLLICVLVGCTVPMASAAQLPTPQPIAGKTCALCGGQLAEMVVNVQKHLPEETLVGGPSYELPYAAQSPEPFTGTYNGIAIDKIRLSLKFRYLAMPGAAFAQGSEAVALLGWQFDNGNMGQIGLSLVPTGTGTAATLYFGNNEATVKAYTWYTLMLECQLATNQVELLLCADGETPVSLGEFSANTLASSWGVMLKMNNVGDCANPNKFGIGAKDLSIDAVKTVVMGNPLCPHSFSEPLRGDVDGNGVVDSDDAIYLLRSTMSANYPLDQSGDMNGDGKADSDDAIHLLRYVLLPERFPLAA